MEEKYNESEALLTVKDLKMHFPFAEKRSVLSGSPVAENQPQPAPLHSCIRRRRVPSCLRGWSLRAVHAIH